MAKFLITKNNEILQPNSQFSGIFKKALIVENKQKTSSTQFNTSENSSSTSYEFLTPKTKAVRLVSSPIKELNLKDYFGKFLDPESDISDIIRQITKSFNDGQITFKT